MGKKISIITAISILIIILSCTFSFATSQSGVVGNIYDDASNMIMDDGRAIGNTFEDGAEMINNGATMVENMMENEGNMLTNGVNEGRQTLNDIGGDAKNTTETMTDSGVFSGNNLSDYKFLGMNLSVWLWIALIIIIIIVIVLICRYMQNHENNDNNDDDDNE